MFERQYDQIWHVLYFYLYAHQSKPPFSSSQERLIPGDPGADSRGERQIIIIIIILYLYSAISIAVQ